MPNIPIYNAPYPNIAVSDRGVEAWNQAARRIGELGRERARLLQEGFSNFGQSISKVAEKLKQNRDYDDRIKGVRSLAQLKESDLNQLNTIVSKTNPDDLPNALAQFHQESKGRLDQWKAQFAGGSKHTQLWAEEQADTYSLQQSHRFAADSAVAAGNGAVANIGHTANSISKTLSNNPTFQDIDSAVKTWDQMIQAVDMNPNITTTAEKEKIRKSLEAEKSQFIETGIYRAIDGNPAVANDMVKRFGDFLTPQQQRSVLEHSQQSQQKQFWQNRAEQQDAERIQKQGAEQSLVDLTRSTFSVDANGNATGQRFVPPDYFSKVIELSRMPGADHAKLKAATEDAQSILNRQKNGVVASTDPSTYQNLSARAYNGLSDMEIFQAHAAGKLSDHDSTMFHQAVTDATKNPQMAQARQQFNQFVTTYAKPFITKSDMMNPDPVEMQRLQQFENDKWLQFQTGINKGMTPYDLLDQRSKNFIGGDVTNYQLTPDQRLKGMTERATTGQKPIAPIESAPRMPGESPTDYLNRTQNPQITAPAQTPAPGNNIPNAPAIPAPTTTTPLPPAAPAATPVGPTITPPTFNPAGPEAGPEPTE